jgi:hypothetical protein
MSPVRSHESALVSCSHPVARSAVQLADKPCFCQSGTSNCVLHGRWPSGAGGGGGEAHPKGEPCWERLDMRSPADAGTSATVYKGGRRQRLVVSVRARIVLAVCRSGPLAAARVDAFQGLKCVRPCTSVLTDRTRLAADTTHRTGVRKQSKWQALAGLEVGVQGRATSHSSLLSCCAKP